MRYVDDASLIRAAASRLRASRGARALRLGRWLAAHTDAEIRAALGIGPVAMAKVRAKIDALADLAARVDAATGEDA